MTQNKMFLEINFRRGIFYSKLPNSKIFIRPPLDQHVWGCPSALRRSRIKQLTGTKILGIWFERIYFMIKIKTNSEMSPRPLGGLR